MVCSLWLSAAKTVNPTATSPVAATDHHGAFADRRTRLSPNGTNKAATTTNNGTATAGRNQPSAASGNAATTHAVANNAGNNDAIANTRPACALPDAGSGSDRWVSAGASWTTSAPDTVTNDNRPHIR